MAQQPNPYEPPHADEPPWVQADFDEPVALFHPAHGWGNVTILALAGSIVLAVGGLVLSTLLLRLYWSEAGYYASDEDFENQVLDGLNAVFVLLVLLRLVTAGLLLTWMYQVHRNLPALGHVELDSKPIWAVVCWFVPVMNLFCPYQVMHEIWWRSDPGGNVPGGGRAAGLLVQCWWAAWMTVVAMAAVGNFLDQRIETVRHAAMAAGTNAVHFLALIVSGLLLIAIIAKTNRRQVQRHLALQPR